MHNPVVIKEILKTSKPNQRRHLYEVILFIFLILTIYTSHKMSCLLIISYGQALNFLIAKPFFNILETFLSILNVY
jgi:hypothetical protein